MKIVIVDDEQLDLFITKKLLGPAYQVEGFTSLEEATKWAKDNSFDVLLSDYYLSSGLQAPDVLRSLRSVSGTSFRAMVLSNHIDEHQAELLKKAGFDGILEKPITIEKFKSSLDSLR